LDRPATLNWGAKSELLSANERKRGRIASPASLCSPSKERNYGCVAVAIGHAESGFKWQGLAPGSDVHSLIKLRASRGAHFYVVAARPERMVFSFPTVTAYAPRCTTSASLNAGSELQLRQSQVRNRNSRKDRVPSTGRTYPLESGPPRGLPTPGTCGSRKWRAISNRQPLCISSLTSS